MFKVGDKVWCVIYGWGVVKSIASRGSYPVKVIFGKFEKHAKHYTLEGLSDHEYGLRTLFFEEISIPKSALERPHKTAKEMLDECEEVEFKAGEDNWYIYINVEEDRVFEEYCYNVFTYGIKYISKDDAKKIVKECKENNNSGDE